LCSIKHAYANDPPDEHEKCYAALAKAVGRRAYELYRGHISKRQLVEEQKKNIKLEADIANCK
jgi:hypothetical protein